MRNKPFDLNKLPKKVKDKIIINHPAQDWILERDYDGVLGVVILKDGYEFDGGQSVPFVSRKDLIEIINSEVKEVKK